MPFTFGCEKSEIRLSEGPADDVRPSLPRLDKCPSWLSPVLLPRCSVCVSCPVPSCPEQVRIKLSYDFQAPLESFCRAFALYQTQN